MAERSKPAAESRGGDAPNKQTGVFASPMVVRDPVEYLRLFLREREEKGFGPSDAAYVLKTAAREILPGAGLERRCVQLDLFTDWTVHGEIDRSPAGQAALATIAEAIPMHGQDGRDERWLEEQVNGAISFGDLRLELVAVCRRFDLPETCFASWETWHRFAGSLSFEISGRPNRLGRRARAAKDATERIGNTPLEEDHRPHAVMLCIDANGKCWWRVETSGRMFIDIQVLFGGFRPGDFPVPDGWRSPLERG